MLSAFFDVFFDPVFKVNLLYCDYENKFFTVITELFRNPLHVNRHSGKSLNLIFQTLDPRFHGDYT